jgi:hypothetical protein
MLVFKMLGVLCKLQFYVLETLNENKPVPLISFLYFYFPRSPILQPFFLLIFFSFYLGFPTELKTAV